MNQPVEKAAVGPIGSPAEPKAEPKRYKAAHSGPEPGAEERAQAFFNTLEPTTHSGE